MPKPWERDWDTPLEGVTPEQSDEILAADRSGEPFHFTVENGAMTRRPMPWEREWDTPGGRARARLDELDIPGPTRQAPVGPVVGEGLAALLEDDQAAFGFHPQIERAPAGPQQPAAKRTGSVTDTITPREPAVDDFGAPVTAQTFGEIERAMKAMTPDERARTAEREDWRGAVARKVLERWGEPLPTMKKIMGRREDIYEQDIREGASRETAERRARLNAGAPEGLDATGSARVADFDFDTAARYKDASALERGVAKGREMLSQSGGGILKFAAEVAGVDPAGVDATLAQIQRRTEAIGENQSSNALARHFENAVSSMVLNVPGLAYGAVTGAAAVPLLVMSAQVFGQEYDEGRRKGLSPGDAAARGAAFGVAEAIGERVGMPTFLKTFQAATKGVPTEELMGLLAKHTAREIPGELLTTTLQFSADKFAPMGLTPEAGLKDYLTQMGDTLVQTVMQAGTMTGAAIAPNAFALHQRGRAQGRADMAEASAMEKWATQGLVRRGIEAAEMTPQGLADIVSDPASRKVALDKWREEGFAKQKEAMGEAPVQPQSQAPVSLEVPESEPAAAPEVLSALQPEGLADLERRAAVVAGEEVPQGTAGENNPVIPPAPGETTPIDAAAHEAATSPQNDLPEPSDAQKAAGNYKKGHETIAGMDVSIENPAGSTRSGTDADGKRWESRMNTHYGYVKGTVGFDKDHLDVVVKPGTAQGFEGTVYVVNQNKANGHFDEHKAVIGAASQEEAKSLYLSNYEKGWERRIRSIVPMPMADFKAWAYDKSAGGPKGGELKARQQQPAVREQLFIEWNGRRFPVESYEDASRKWDEFRAAADAGSSALGQAQIRDQTGKQVAHISYNGRVWPGERWERGLTPLYDPFARGPEKEVADEGAVEVPAQPASAGEGTGAAAPGAAQGERAAQPADAPLTQEAQERAEPGSAQKSGVSLRRGLYLQIGNTRYAVEDFKQASDMVFEARKEMRRRNGGKEGFIGSPTIHDESGAVVAHVGTMERIIKGKPNGEARPAADSILYDPIPDAAAIDATAAKVQPQAALPPPMFKDFTAPKSNKASGIVKGEIRTFKTEKQAALFASQSGNGVPRGYKPRQTPDGWVLSKPVVERTPAQRAAAQRLVDARTKVSADDDLLTIAGKLGGIDLDDAEVSEADGKKVNKLARLKAFKPGGMSLDDLAEIMAGEGYDVYEDGAVDATKAANILHEAVERYIDSAGKDKTGSPAAQEAWAERDAEARAKFEAETTPTDRKLAGYNELSEEEQAALAGFFLSHEEWASSYPDAEITAEDTTNEEIAAREPGQDEAEDADAGGGGPSTASPQAGVEAEGAQGGQAPRAAQEGPQEGLTLTGQTEAEIRADEARAKRAADEKAKRDNAPAAGDFVLTGSSRPVDEARARGQMELAPNPEQPAAAPVAESQAPAVSDSGDAGVAPGRESGGPDGAAIEDLGEKIGGARKDLASPTGRSGRTQTDDDRPTWARRFKVGQIVKAGGQIGDIKDEGRWVIRDSRDTDWRGMPRQVGRDLSFATKEEAEAYVPIAAVSLKHRAVMGSNGKYEIWRTITDRKRVKVVEQQFDSREAAMEYMVRNAAAIVETNTTFGEADIPLPPDRARTGPERRRGNVSGDDFMQAFGFRGVEFGNWNNQDERQALMNDAYDGLMDLADVLGVPPKALSLNGDLAIAFGARGHGLNSARANYERTSAVINLTKERGAGSLAHEWFHAADHYFGRQDGKASAEWKIGKDGTRTLDTNDAERDYASGGFRRDSGVRQEVRDAYNRVIETMAKKATQYVEDTAKADAFVGRARDDLAGELKKLRDELAAQKDPQYYKRNNKPATAEQLAEFDAIAKRMLDGEAQAVSTDWRGVETAQKKIAYRWTNDSLEQIGAIYKAVRGRSGFTSERSGWLDSLRNYMARYSERLKMLADAQSGEKKTRFAPTEFAMNARELDQGRGEDYWTTPHEMAARAFQGYVEDRIAERGGVSRFLNYAPEKGGILTPWGVKFPFPRGEERKTLNAAFDDLFKVIETKETDKGVAMFSRAADNFDAMRFEKGEKDGMPAFRNAQIELSPAEVESTHTLVDDEGRPEGKAQTIRFEIREPGGERVGWLRSDVADDGEILNVRLIEIKKSARQKGRGLGEGVLASILATNHPSTVVEIIDIVVVRPEDEIPGEPKRDARGFWKKMGAKWRNFSSDPMVQMDGFITRAGYLKARKGQGNEEARVQVPDSERQGALRSREGARDQQAALRGAGEAQGEEGSLDFTGFRRGDAGRGLTKAQARAALVDAFGERAVSALESSGILHLTASEWDWPAQFHPLMRGGERGVYHKGRAYIAAGSHRTASGIVQTALHEIGEHHGLEAMLGKEKYAQLARRVETLRKAGNPAVKAAWAEVKHQESYRPGSPRFMAEVIARVGQDQRVQKMAWWRELLDAIRAFVIKHYSIPSGNLTEEHVKTLLRAALAKSARQAIAESERRAGNARALARAIDGEVPQFHLAYHGSPHDFDAFSTEHVGTGEGAQAYGWGLYYAGRKEVAEHYRNTLADRDRNRVTYKGKNVDSDSMLGRALIDMDRFGKEAALRTLDDSIKFNDKYAPDMARQYRAMKETIQAADPAEVSVKKGRLYEVELAPKDDEYLSWDSLMDEQGEPVLAALRKSDYWRYAEERIEAAAERRGANPTGADLYRDLLDDYSPKEASLFLKSLGIPGIKYLDGSSRGFAGRGVSYRVEQIGDKWAAIKTGQSVGPQHTYFDTEAEAREWVEEQQGGRHNYVIFDDSDVAVRAKFARGEKQPFKTGEPATVMAYHGSPDPAVKFEDGRPAFFTDNPELANGYTTERGLWRTAPRDGATVYRATLRMQNPLVIDARGARSDNIPVPWQEWKPKAFGNLPKNAVGMSDLVAKARTDGHDGVIVQNVIDTAYTDDKEKSTVYVVYSPGQITDGVGVGVQFSRAQTDTPAFRAWFKDSKVVGKDGQPLVVYHGTASDFPRFDRRKLASSSDHHTAEFGFFFSGADTASFFAETADGGGGGANVMPVFLRIERPYEMSASEFIEIAEDASATDVRKARARLVAHGYDGIVIRGDIESMWEELHEDNWIAFSPSQIKSAIGNRGAFSAGSADIRFSRGAEPAPVWFSALARAVDGAKQEVAPAAQWKAWIKNQPGVKADEIEWSGVNEWLDTQGPKVTKAALLDYLRGNGVRVDEVALGDTAGEAREVSFQEAQRLLRERGDAIKITNQYDGRIYPDRMDMMHPAQRYFAQEVSEATKFSSYQLPGGSNYRELLLTLPPRKPALDRSNFKLLQREDTGEWEIRERATDLVAADGIEASNADEAWERAATGNGVPEFGGDSVFRSSHFDTPNILAHVRFNERADAEGKRILFLEEIQSDWAQKGKREGFGEESVEVREVRRLDLPKSERNSFIGDPEVLYEAIGADGRRLYISQDRTHAERRGRDLARRGIPAAPFVGKTEAWVGLAAKRMIRYAVDNGFDGIAWTTGEQQADRYDLSKKVDTLSYVKREDGYRIDVIPAGRRSEWSNLGVFGEKDLPDAVGKDVADRIIRGDGEKQRDGTKYLTGLDLKVGGGGMAAFYDRIVPNVVNDLLKKMGGGRVGAVEFGGMTGRARNPYTVLEVGTGYFVEGGGERIGPFAVEEQAKAALADILAKRESRAQPGFYLTPAMKEKAAEGMPMFSRALHGSRASWDAPEPSKMDSVIYALQDKHIDTKRVLQAVRQGGKAVADVWDAYLQEELFHGRAAKRTVDFLDLELRPLLTDMAARQVGVQEFEEFLHARHAEERNLTMAERNPTREQLDAKLQEIRDAIKNAPPGSTRAELLHGELAAWARIQPFDGTEEERQSLSGMSTPAAKAYLEGLDPEKRRAFEALAKRIDGITAGTRDMLIKGGVDSSGDFNRDWKAYVPLNREETGVGSGQGFSVRGRSSKRATGSTRAVIDILANIAMQRERAIVRVEKNRVANSLVGLATINPHADFWQVNVPPKIKTVDERTGLVVEMVDPTFKSRDNVVIARIPDGKGGIAEHAVIFNDGDERAMRMAMALKNLDADQLGHVLGTVAKATRYLASVNTQYNPVFGLVNITRDVQGALFNLSTTEIAGKQSEVLKHTISALGGIYRDVRAARRGEEADSAWSHLWEEFAREGGKTGFRDMFATSTERAARIEAELRKASQGKAMGAARAVFDWLSDYNDTLENAVRLAAYKVALDAGLTKPRAASLAKNLTVNFNRGGQVKTQVGALYAFLNASVQGTACMAETLAGPKGKQIVAGGILLGAVQAVALAFAGFDDDEPPDFVRERNLIIPIGDKKYLTVPMPLGLHVLPNIGRIGAEFALSGFRNPGKRLAQFANVFAEAFNPVGNAGWSMQTLTPSVVDPFAALAENKDWTGKPIYREDFSKLNPTPGHARGKNTSSWFAQMVSKGFNYATGGTEFKPGAFSPTPDQIDYLIGQATGGVGREVSKVEQTVRAVVSGQDLPPYKIPIVGRLYGDAKSQSSQASRFYDNLRELAGHEAEIKGRKKAGGNVGAYLKENPEARLWEQANQTERIVSRLRKEREKMQKDGAPAQHIRAKEARIAKIMLEFNERVTKARESRAP